MRSVLGPWALPRIVLNYPLSSFQKTRMFRQFCMSEMYLVWVVTIGDLVVADPDIGYIVINVTHPHL
jgi:hypothetical protein